MPVFAVDHEQAVAAISVSDGETGFDGRERDGFDIAALAVETLELGGELSGAVRVARGEELDDVGGDIHAAGGVDARREAEGDIEAGELLAGRIERGRGEERAQAGADGAAQLAQAERGDGAVFAAEWNRISDGGDGGHFEKAGQSLFAGASGIAALEKRLRELEGDGGAAERFLRVSAAGLIGIEDGERGGELLVRVSADGGR